LTLVKPPGIDSPIVSRVPRQHTFIRAIAALAAAAAIGMPAIAPGQTPGDVGKPLDIGKREYDANCAACHGPLGRGDGPKAHAGGARAADLTVLARRNGGFFPFAQVYEFIDGRRLVKAHGTREMPVWGRGYRAEAAEYYAQAPANAEAHVRERILALTEYVYRLQAK
jgi:mono/diheme cytochrome c family protein